MAFPGAIASFAGFISTHTLAADSHASQHNSEQTEIIATQTKIGTGSSTPTSGTVLRGTGVGTSDWAQIALTTDVTGILPTANGGTGQANLTGLTMPSAVLSGPTVSDPDISGTVSGGATYSSPTLTTPTIADFTNATHNHSNNAGGGQLGSSAIVSAAITDDKLVYGKLRSRQGGSATNWQTTGTTTYDYSATNTFIQSGSIAMNASPTTITFPTAFNQIPIIVATPTSVTATNVFIRITSISATQASLQAIDASNNAITTETANWIAIGE